MELPARFGTESPAATIATCIEIVTLPVWGVGAAASNGALLQTSRSPPLASRSRAWYVRRTLWMTMRKCRVLYLTMGGLWVAWALHFGIARRTDPLWQAMPEVATRYDSVHAIHGVVIVLAVPFLFSAKPVALLLPAIVVLMSGFTAGVLPLASELYSWSAGLRMNVLSVAMSAAVVAVCGVTIACLAKAATQMRDSTVN